MSSVTLRNLLYNIRFWLFVQLANISNVVEKWLMEHIFSHVLTTFQSIGVYELVVDLKNILVKHLKMLI